MNRMRSKTKVNYTCIKELMDGDYFGEMALINNSPRSARIVAHSDCHFATLDK